MSAIPQHSRQAFLTRAYSRNEIFWDMDNVRQYDVCVVGDENVGKTALITQLFKESFLSIHVHTNESVVQQKQIKLMDKSISSEELSTIMLNVYDTSSKDEKAIETFLSRKTSSDGLGFLFVYSIRSRSSAESFFRFKNYITSLTIDGEIPPIVIVGNQSDNETTREVRKEEGEELSRSLYVPFMEVSATNNSQVREAFFTLIREISYRIEQDKQPLQKEDWLEKKAGLRKAWKTRWFVLEDLQLRYYPHQRESRKDKPKGTINLVECQVADHPKHGLALVITTNNARKYVLRASNMEQKIEWARLIIRAREKILLSLQQAPPPAISPRSEGIPVSVLAAEIEANTLRKRSSFTLKQEEGALSSSPLDPEASRPRSRSAGDSSSSGSFSNAPPTTSPSTPVVISAPSPTTITSVSKSKPRSPREATSSEVVMNGESHPPEGRKKSKEDVLSVEGTTTSDVSPSPKIRKKPTLLGLFIGRNDH